MKKRVLPKISGIVCLSPSCLYKRHISPPCCKVSHEFNQTLVCMSQSPTARSCCYPSFIWRPASKRLQVLAHNFIHRLVSVYSGSRICELPLKNHSIRPNIWNNQTAVTTALPIIVAELHGSQFVWVGSAYALSATAFLPMSGGLAQVS